MSPRSQKDTRGMEVSSQKCTRGLGLGEQWNERLVRRLIWGSHGTTEWKFLGGNDSEGGEDSTD